MFFDKEPINIQLIYDSNSHSIATTKKTSKEELIKLLENITKDEKTNFYVNVRGENISFDQLSEENKLEEILEDGRQIIASNEILDGLIAVIYSFDGKSKTERFSPREKMRTIFAQFESIFGENSDLFTWKYKNQEYFPNENDETELIEMSDERQMILNVSKKISSEYKVEILLINDQYELNREKKTYILTFKSKPTYKQLIDSLREKEPEIEVYNSYKINNFDEPVKNIGLTNGRELSFDNDHFLKIMLKTTQGKLDFEIQRFIVYTANIFPQDLQKHFEIKIEEDLLVSNFKTQILQKAFEIGVIIEKDQSKYLFQFLNQFNIPSKYLIQDNSLLKKHTNKINKLLIRISDVILPKSGDFISIFVRQRITKKRTYEGYTQIFVPKSMQKITSASLSAFREFLVSKLSLKVEPGVLALTIVNYKNFEWKRLEKGETTLKDGDEIGYLIKNESCAFDDLQTDELMALALNENRENYVFNHKFVKETPFMINLEN